MTGTANGGGLERPRPVRPSGAEGRGAGEEAAEWARAVDAFAAWLADSSPFYRQLRMEVPVPDDAPARLAYFWRTVGWVPGIGLGRYDDSIPPVRELGQAEADKAFQRWLGRECFAPAMALSEPTPQALWDRLPRRCWVYRATIDQHRCHGGALWYVDEDAGDDPPMMVWKTNEDGRDTDPVSPRVASPSSIANLLGNTLAGIAGSHGIVLDLPVPAQPGPFAPVYPYFWPLGDGVWGLPDTRHRGAAEILAEAPATIAMVVVYRSARACLDYVAGLPAEQLPSYARIDGAHAIDVVDAKTLAPQRLVERGFTFSERQIGSVAVGRLDGIPVAVFQSTQAGPVRTVFRVASEDYPAFQELVENEGIQVRRRSWVVPAHWWVDPDDDARARVASLVERAAGRTVTAPPAPKRTSQVTPAVASDPAEEAAVRAEAAGLREWILTGCPGLELTPPELAADEPPLVRAFWEELGYNSELEDVLGWPDRASSERALAKMLATYESTGEYKLRRASLPKHLRIVFIDSADDSRLLVTDEDTPVDDPPMRAVDAESGVVEAAEDLPSYLGWIGENAVAHAMGQQPNWPVRTEPALSGLGTQPFPRLAPTIRYLAPGIWAWTHPETHRTTVGAPRFRDLVEWLAQTTIIDRLELCPRYGTDKPAARIALTRFTPPAGLREWRAPSGDARCYAGLVDDVPVLVKVADGVVLFTPHADRKRAMSVAAAAGWT